MVAVMTRYAIADRVESQSMLAIECTIPPDVTILDWRRSRPVRSSTTSSRPVSRRIPREIRNKVAGTGIAAIAILLIALSAAGVLSIGASTTGTVKLGATGPAHGIPASWGAEIAGGMQPEWALAVQTDRRSSGILTCSTWELRASAAEERRECLSQPSWTKSLRPPATGGR
jgi:hypothetical protein